MEKSHRPQVYGTFLGKNMKYYDHHLEVVFL